MRKNQALTISPFHEERCRQIHALISRDVLSGMPVETAVENLATFLHIDAASVALAVAIANDLIHNEGRRVMVKAAA